MAPGARQVMKRKGINHEEYRKMQNDIDYVVRCATNRARAANTVRR
jgi:hypothetical protein